MATMLQFQPSDDRPVSPNEQDEFGRFDFQSVSTRAAGDERLGQALRSATLHYCHARDLRLKELPDSDALRHLAAQIRQHTLDHLDYYLEQLAGQVERNGGQVHFAADGAEARRIILEIARRAGCRNVVKSKSRVSDEIGLMGAMQHAGLDIVETDLGRFIGQISHDRPSHPHISMVHKGKGSIARALSEYIEVPPTDSPQQMGMHVRAHLRDKYRQADMGITGASFLIAETGQVCLLSNDGNARQCMEPRVLVTLAGIEKVVPRMMDLTVLVKLLGRSATGQTMAVYTSFFGGLGRSGQDEGAEEFHLVLLDNGRSRILDSGYREALRCIGCGACLNACPVYRKVGGQAYGHVYSGPIGAVIAPLLGGLEQYKDLPQASTLCGVCADVCPVRIDIPKHLISLRREIVANRLDGQLARRACHLWARVMSSGFLGRVSGVLRRWGLHPRAKGGEWISQAPGILAHWTQTRDLPAPARKTFHQLWMQRRSSKKEASHD